MILAQFVITILAPGFLILLTLTVVTFKPFAVKPIFDPLRLIELRFG
uniref:Uncharacterized protein n=1 Tax=Podoviridae sp. ctG4L18 TaxID=2825234 RepID=A0A8S5UPH5_9CAUD|nr:MAG TPA: hypothetical protein [Podoviridae sp. ctG4L18]